jgi:hypothetical protein
MNAPRRGTRPRSNAAPEDKTLAGDQKAVQQLLDLSTTRQIEAASGPMPFIRKTQRDQASRLPVKTTRRGVATRTDVARLSAEVRRNSGPQRGSSNLSAEIQKPHSAMHQPVPCK